MADSLVVRDFVNEYEIARMFHIRHLSPQHLSFYSDSGSPHAWNPLYSTKLRDLTGLHTPWEQWVAIGATIGGSYQAVRLAVRNHRPSVSSLLTPPCARKV
jgi:hypothetical protein